MSLPIPPEIPIINEPEASTTSDSEPPAKKSKQEPQKQQRYINVAIAGCSHGEMDRIYSTIESIERNQNKQFDLLICCGDYQAIRNLSDLHTMHVSPKYRQLGTFHQYYSGQKIAPIFTIFVGGNHESSGFLAELPNGGWVAPNIWYMGYANVVKFAGLTIGGLSGIYKPGDYHRGHFERPPFNEPGAVVSSYHVRSLEIFRLKQLARRDGEHRPNCLDIMITHDWPCGITDYGNTHQLLRYKPFFKEDIDNKRLGNPETMEVLKMLRPKHWFSAHLHCKYEATVEHEALEDIGITPEPTKFLALGKPAPKQRYLETMEIPIPDDAEMTFEYDPIWCSILRNTDSLMRLSNRNVYLPSKSSSERWDYRPSPDEMAVTRNLVKNDFTIPDNYKLTAPPHQPHDSPREPCLYYLNPQTTEFCDKFGITNFNRLLYQKTSDCNGIPYCDRMASNQGNLGGAEEINLDDLDDDDDNVNGDEFGDDFFTIDDDGDSKPDKCCEDEELEEPTAKATETDGAS